MSYGLQAILSSYKHEFNDEWLMDHRGIYYDHLEEEVYKKHNDGDQLYNFFNSIWPLTMIRIKSLEEFKEFISFDSKELVSLWKKKK
jgi:hypothetical protein